VPSGESVGDQKMASSTSKRTLTISGQVDNEITLKNGEFSLTQALFTKLGEHCPADDAADQFVTTPPITTSTPTIHSVCLPTCGLLALTLCHPPTPTPSPQKNKKSIKTSKHKNILTNNK
jgi:hypothetical protein